MRILFDTNVVLDVILDRQPHVLDSRDAVNYVEHGDIEGILSATTVTTIYYVASRHAGAAQALRHVRTLLSLFDIALVNRAVLTDAMSLGFSDYEDAVLHESARLAGADGIVTRNQRDFGNASIHVYTPTELLRMIRASR